MKKLKWSNKVFQVFFKKRKNFIGSNIIANVRSKNRILSHEGVCLWVHNKNWGNVNNVMVIRKKFGNTIFFIQFPLYLGGVYTYNTLSSNNKKTVVSRLSSKRFFKY